MSPIRQPSLGEALCAFREANGLHRDEAARRFWSCRVGPVRLVLPNFVWRRQAIEAHDLHHVLTGYPCTMCGEFEMAAWEFGAGPMPHWAATLFCLPLILAGLFRAPCRTFRAFADGRKARSLHRANDCERWLALPLSVARAALNREARGGMASDLLAFALLVLRSGAIMMSPFLLGYLAIRLQ